MFTIAQILAVTKVYKICLIQNKKSHAAINNHYGYR